MHVESVTDSMIISSVCTQEIISVYICLGWSLENCGVERISERKLPPSLIIKSVNLRILDPIGQGI